jgi:hypothetical protein
MQLKLTIGKTLPSAVHSSQYSIFVSCNKCGGLHETGISVTLGDGPVDKQSVGDFYGEKSVPRSLANLTNNSVTCPRTGKQSTQKNSHQIFLVPTRS